MLLGFPLGTIFVRDSQLREWRLFDVPELLFIKDGQDFVSAAVREARESPAQLVTAFGMSLCMEGIDDLDSVFLHRLGECGGPGFRSGRGLRIFILNSAVLRTAPG